MKNKLVLIPAVWLLLTSNCFGQTTATEAVLPATDPDNAGGWNLNPDVSDEFEGIKLDTEKWLIQGTEGVYKSNFIGRAPSQFSTENVRLEDGKLKLATKWEPDFDFSKKPDMSDKKKPEGTPFENITTAAVISKKQFLYGYMEIKCKAADASITSSFWMTGNNVELDVFEFLANPAEKQKTQLPTELWSSIHDWSKGGKSTWTDRMQLDWRVADGFHTYGVEWQEDYLKFYADGKQVRNVTKEQVGAEGWVITSPLWVWVDSETFPWHGIPVEADLPVDYEIEYIRIWQGKSPADPQATGPKSATTANQQNSGATSPANGKTAHVFDSTLYGFEGPAMVDGKELSWWIPNESRDSFSIVNEKSNGGTKSLKFTNAGSLSDKVVAFAPNGSTVIGAGEHEFSVKVWVEPGSSLKNFQVILEDPWLELKPFDLSSVETGQWITLTQTFNRNTASGPKDRPKFLINSDAVSGETSTVYFDDLTISDPNGTHPPASESEAHAGTENLIDSTLYGFEGPAVVDGKEVAWWIPNESKTNFLIVGEKSAGGQKSLKFTNAGPLPDKVVAFSPNGSTKLDAGQYEFSVKVWVEAGSSLKNFQVVFEDPWLELKPFDLTHVEPGKWVTLTQEFNRNAASGAKDRPRFVVQPDAVSGATNTIYFDDVSIHKK